MSYANWRRQKQLRRKFMLRDIRTFRTCYLFLAPYALIFTLFYVVPVVVSIWFGFTYYNVLQPARFIGMQNYINLILVDDIFLTAVKNTFLIAAITGPVGYIAAFLFAWLIHELPKRIRAFAVLVFYAPTISGQVYLIWTFIFSGDSYGYANAIGVDLGILESPKLWLTDPRYMMTIVIIVILWASLGTGFLSFIAGLNTIPDDQYEAGYVDGVKNRWQELWYITLPSMRPQLMFGAIMAITGSFGFGGVVTALCGFPSVEYAAHTIVHHLEDYGGSRYEIGYSSAIAVILFVIMISANMIVKKALSKVGN